MSQYYNLDDPFMNNSELDKMARDINNNKKKLNSSIPKSARQQEATSCVGVECLMDPSYSRFAPSSLGADITQFSSDFTSGFPTSMGSIELGGNSDDAQNSIFSPDMLSVPDDLSVGLSNSLPDKFTSEKSKLFSNTKGTKISKLLKNKNNYSTNYGPNYNPNYDSNSISSAGASIVTINTNSSNSENSASTTNSDSVFTDSDKKSKKYKIVIKNGKPKSGKKVHFNKYTDKYSNKRYSSPLYLSESSDIDFGGSLISDVSSNYSTLSPKLKNQFRMNSQHLKHYGGNNDKDILEHTAHCPQCKNILTDLIKSVVAETSVKQFAENQYKNNYVDQTNNKSFNQNISQFAEQNGGKINLDKSDMLGINMPELKELLILVVIGIFIIVFIDIFMRK